MESQELNKSMVGIYWDTATDWGVVEIFKILLDDKNKILKVIPIYQFCEHRPKESSVQLVTWIQNALHIAKIQKPNWIFVSKGPGSFTGIRIAVSTARNLSQLWEIPCIGLDTMQIYRVYFQNKYPNLTVIIIFKSNQERYFVGTTEGTHDWNANELKNYIDSQKKADRNIKIITVNSMPNLEFGLNIEGIEKNFPMITDIPVDFYWNESMEPNLDKWNYKNLIPNYMRESYATNPTHPKQKNP